MTTNAGPSESDHSGAWPAYFSDQHILAGQVPKWSDSEGPVVGVPGGTPVIN